MSPAPRWLRYGYKLLLRAVLSTGQGASAVDSPLMSPAPRSPRYVYKLLPCAVLSTGQGASVVGLTAYVSCSPLTKVCLYAYYSLQYSAPDREPARWDSPLMSPAPRGMSISWYSAQYSAPDREPAQWDSPLMSPAPRWPYFCKLRSTLPQSKEFN